VEALYIVMSRCVPSGPHRQLRRDKAGQVDDRNNGAKAVRPPSDLPAADDAASAQKHNSGPYSHLHTPIDSTYLTKSFSKKHDALTPHSVLMPRAAALNPAKTGHLIPPRPTGRPAPMPMRKTDKTERDRTRSGQSARTRCCQPSQAGRARQGTFV